MSDLYNTLGIDRSANPDEIKRAYRKLAAQHHPDRGGDTKKFQEIQAAYDTLSDPEKRNAYDNPPQQPSGFHFQGGFPPGFEDIFAHFGGDPLNGFFGRRQAPRNKNLNIQASITLEEAFAGKQIVATLKLPSGREQAIEIKIPAGIQDGTTLRLANIGDDSIPGAPRGDIFLNVQVQPHSIFARQNDDLIQKIEISCIEAMLGTNKIIETLDKRSLEIKINSGTQHNQILSINSYGMPNINDNRFRGRMLINVEIKIPEQLTEAQINLLKQFYN
jgi:DnaJ-class molecular chaperone